MAEETFEFTSESAAALGKLTQAFNPHRVDEPVVGIPGGREPNEVWELDGGTAWVWLAPGNETLTKPVIIADGFSAGASFLAEWAGLWKASGIVGVHPWGTQLHEAGHDVVVLGYDSRSAPISDNARVAIECIRRAIQERSGDTPLVVGGLSMGGLVTRYALLQMEELGIDHEVETYFSYDSPHRGAWIPISLQTFAHFLKGIADQLHPVPPERNRVKNDQLGGLSVLLNSPASRELVWKHTATHKGVGPDFSAAPEREALLKRLEEMGSWPKRPTKLAVANGRGDGHGLDDVKPGELNLDWPPKKQLVWGPGAKLYAQNGGTDKLAGIDQHVATLIPALQGTEIRVSTTGIPALDGAPGGTLDSFGIAAHALQAAGFDATAAFPDVCFVPVASAVDLGDPSDPFASVNGMNPDDSGLDEYKVASQNEAHTLLTKELCTWLTERFSVLTPAR